MLTHGFIVKPDGTKVSKSDKEYVTATKEIERHGADLLRLWSLQRRLSRATSRRSPKVIKEFGDKYRKIRNTLRYLLSQPVRLQPGDRLPQEIPPNSLDGWASASSMR